MEQIEVKSIAKLQETQNREAAVMGELEKAIEESVSNHNVRLKKKKDDDAQRRKDIRKYQKSI